MLQHNPLSALLLRMHSFSPIKGAFRFILNETMWEVLFNTSQLKEWVDAAKKIQDSFGIEKALGYLIGEKFYRVVSMLQLSQELTRRIAEERKKPGYKPIGETTYRNHKIVTNMDEIYDKNIVIIADTEEALDRFATLIKEAFEPHQIRSYLESNPRLGISRTYCIRGGL